MGQAEDYANYKKAVQDYDAQLAIVDSSMIALDAAVGVMKSLLAQYIPPPTPAPVIEVGPDLSTTIGIQVSLSMAVVGGQTPFSAVWSFGDGTSGIGLSTSHSYTAPGVYTVVATLTDNMGRAASDSLNVTATAVPVPPATYDPTKGATNLAVKDNGDGTISAKATLPPGVEYARYYYVPSTNALDYTRFQQTPNNPASPYTAPNYALANGSWTFAVMVWGRVNNMLVQSSKGASLPFAMPGGNVPPPSGGGGGGGPPPVPLPTPLPPMTAASKPRLLLSTQTQNRIRGIASAATQQWANFIVEANKWMNYPVYGNYQGSQGIIGPNYALAGVIHEDDYPALASDYKDKALAELEALITDYQKGPNSTCERSMRGDGVTKTVLILDDFLPASFKVYLADITTKTITRQKPPYPYGNYDEVQYYSHFLKVTQGSTVYTEGVDWCRNDALPNSAIEWGFNANGTQPLPGSQYEVELCSVFGSSPVACTVDPMEKTFTLPTAPRTDQYIFTEYCYHDLTRRFRQTSEGTGGFNSVTIDATYTSRNLGCNVALVLDWCWDHPHFDADLKQRAMTMMVRWADWLKVNGYVMSGGSPLRNPTGSNYTMGHYVSWALTAAALFDRHPEGPRIQTEVLNWRKTYVIPFLTAATTSLKGGFWPEGWSYGPFAVRNLMVAALSLEELGVDISAERAWASECVRHLISASPTKSTIYDGGDWFSYPAPFPEKTLPALLEYMADDVNCRAYAQKMANDDKRLPASSDWPMLVFDDPTRPASDWSAEPLQWLASGTGLLTMRDSWEVAA